MLKRVRVVLSHTSHPGNIGATARAMKTMGLHDLRLVNPERFPDADATARASGADDVLAAARVCDDIDDALAGCHFVVGASARSRRIACPVVSPADCASRVIEESGQGDVAILFGCERSGLDNDELDRCHNLVQIPTSPEYASLNLAAAVQIICYEVFLAEAGTDVHSPGEHRPVKAEEMERLYAHMEETLVELEFLDRSNPRLLMRRLRRLFNRARPDANEVNILRGILTAAQQTRRR